MLSNGTLDTDPLGSKGWKLGLVPFATVPVVKVTGGSWVAGQAVEVFPGKPGSDPRTGILAYVTQVSGGKTLTLNADLTSVTLDQQPRLRKVDSTFKRSRDNGSVVTLVTRIKDNEITVQDLGPDMVLEQDAETIHLIVCTRLDRRDFRPQLAMVAQQ